MTCMFMFTFLRHTLFSLTIKLLSYFNFHIDRLYFTLICLWLDAASLVLLSNLLF